jgi:hypothetical protein
MTEISSKQAETFINVFSNLGEAFSKLAKTNIIPSYSLLSQINNSIYLGKKTLDSDDNSYKSSNKINNNSINKDLNKFSKEKKFKKIKKKYEEEDSEKSIISSQNLELEEDNKKIKNDSFFGKNVKNENNNNNKEIFFTDQKGWSIKIKQNGLSIEMGPFISEKKAKLTISYIKRNQEFLNLIDSVKKRKEWLINLSNFIEQLLE